MSNSSVASTPRQVRTTVAAISPRSALKIGAAVGICLFVAWMIAALLAYILLGATGVWDRVNSLAGDLLGSGGVSAGTFFGLAAAIGVLEVVVAVLFMPLAALLYNAVAGYVGGLSITLTEGITLGTEPDLAPSESSDAEDAEQAGQGAESEEPSEDAQSTTVGEKPNAAAAGWGG